MRKIDDQESLLPPGAKEHSDNFNEATTPTMKFYCQVPCGQAALLYFSITASTAIKRATTATTFLNLRDSDNGCHYTFTIAAAMASDTNTIVSSIKRKHFVRQ